MKYYAHKFLLLALITGVLSLPNTSHAQDLRLKSISGMQLRKVELERGDNILIFWASWSPRGQDIVKRINLVESEWESTARVISINFQEARSTAENFIRGKNISVPVFLDTDGAFTKSYSLKYIPGLIVFDDGKVVYKGRLPKDPRDLLRKLFHVD